MSDKKMLLLENNQFWKNYSPKYIQNSKCLCNKLNKLTKNRHESNRTPLSNGKPLRYPDTVSTSNIIGDKNPIIEIARNKSVDEEFLKTFQITSQLSLSLPSRHILGTFKNKYIYYAIDDIKHLLQSDLIQKNLLLGILYSSILSLHNEFSINFFDIWIESIYFNESLKKNRFFKHKINSLTQTSQTTITLKLHCFRKKLVKKPQPLW